ncbi:MAG: efflux transporter outer membrane subunit [Candidatus Sphingomonas phytovorans]|nr:efflux transporter outer membrane subunit [Sphingomonas sp.]WEK01136.1 MAG: efflux transporter outer membrane subunit [Sphingomonas sp.]
MTRSQPLLAILACTALTACNLVPPYQRPSMAIPASFKEAPGWQPASPADDKPRGDWWAGMKDPVLDGLERQVATRNQTVAGAIAAYDQARAVVRESRSALFPSLTGSLGVSSTGTVDGSTVSTSTGTATGTRETASLGATWQPDLFGGLRAGLAQSKATAAQQAAALGNVILAAQGELANDYIQLRGVDAQIDAYDATLTAYRRTLQITQNRYNVGVAARIDVLQAETTLRNAAAQATDLVRQRAIYEHAIAVLAGELPSSLSLAKTAWVPTVPVVPPVIPSALLERRPDVASAERAVIAANAGIGVQRAAFFPNLSLTAGLDRNASSIGSLASLGASVWSLGLTGAMTLLDFGGRSAKVAQARAAYDQAVASYRQTVLTAFQQVEDGLSGTVVLEREIGDLKAASVAADRVEQLTLNQYLGGIADYTTVVTAQATALTARRALISGIVNQQLNAIALQQAVGGGWDASAAVP